MRNTVRRPNRGAVPGQT